MHNYTITYNMYKNINTNYVNVIDFYTMKSTTYTS